MNTTTCPHCGRVNYLHASPTSQTPEPGDVSICWICKKLAIYTDTDVRLPTPEEQAELDADPHIKAMLDVAKTATGPRQATRMMKERS